jgi:hypothetical protein
MWIEVFHAGKKMLFNSDLITLIDPRWDTLNIQVMGTGAAVQFTFESAEDLQAYYDGFLLALNGLDFICGATDTLPSGYIKPLYQGKNEVLYRHIMLKEVLGERK